MYGKITNITNILAYACCAVFVFLIPFGWQSANYILGSFALFAVMNPKLYSNFKSTRLSFAEKAVLALTAAYIIWEFVTMLWSFNTGRGMKVITRHLPLFAMPCLMVIAKIGGIIKRPGVILQIFCLGVLVSMVLCLILSYRDSWYVADGATVFDHRLPSYRDRDHFTALSSGYSYFSYSHLSHFENPHYLATFINVVMMMLYVKFYQSNFKGWRVVILSVLVVFCVSFLFLLCNRANYIIFAIMLCMIAIFELFIKKHRSVGVAMSVSIVAIVVIMFSTGRGYDMLFKMQRAVAEKGDNQPEMTEEQRLERINSRTIIWTSASHLIAKHPILGSGVGDTMEALIGQYYIDGYLETGDAGFNSHNQYLDTWIGLGLVGVLLLLSLIAIPIIAGFKYGYLPLILYGMSLVVGFVTEVMFTHSTGDFSITLIMMLMIMSAIEKVNATKSLSVTVERT